VSRGRTALLGCLALAAFSGAPPAAGDEPSAVDAFLKKVKTAMADQKTTAGRFKQTKKLAIFDDKVESSGSFAIKRPDRLRWEITTPFKSILVIAGDKGARWNETRKAVERFALADKPGIDVAVKQMFTWYSGTFDDVKGPFDVTIAKDGRSVALVPKNEKVREVLSKVTLVFAASLATIDSIAMEEKGGDRTDIVFEGVETNKDLDDKVFAIEDKK
jgi:outer membrane lipoprotein-sorting protein